MRNKKYYAMVMVFVLMMLQTLPIYAGESVKEEWYELVEEDMAGIEWENTDVTPYTLYLMDVITSIAKVSSSKVGMHANVYCSSVMKSINITFKLQKLSGSAWTTVGSTLVSDANVSSTSKGVTASGVSTGTYRAKAVVKVTDAYGYSETLTGYSGSIKI